MDIEELHRDGKVLGKRPAGYRGDASDANGVLCHLPTLCLGGDQPLSSWYVCKKNTTAVSFSGGGN